MINRIVNNNFFNSSNYSFSKLKNEKENKNPILKAIEEMVMRKSITEKEIKGEKLTKKEQEFKDNNIVIPDPDVLLLNMLKSKDIKSHNSKQSYLKDEKNECFKDSNNDIFRLSEILNNC